MKTIKLQTPIEYLIEALKLNPYDPHVIEALEFEKIDFKTAYETGFSDAHPSNRFNKPVEVLSEIEFNERYGKD